MPEKKGAVGEIGREERRALCRRAGKTYRGEVASARKLSRRILFGEDGSTELPKSERNRGKVGIREGRETTGGGRGGVPTGNAAHPVVYQVRSIIITRGENSLHRSTRLITFTRSAMYARERRFTARDAARLF